MQEKSEKRNGLFFSFRALFVVDFNGFMETPKVLHLAMDRPEWRDFKGFCYEIEIGSQLSHTYLYPVAMRS